MAVGGYRHYYEDFYEKTSFQMSINRERTTTTEGAHASLVRILSFLLFLSWLRALKRRSNHLETMWIPLEARHLNIFKKSFKETCKYIFSYILDDRIICSWCLNVLNIRFKNSTAFDVLIKILRKLSTSDPNTPMVSSPNSNLALEMTRGQVSLLYHIHRWPFGRKTSNKSMCEGGS